MHSSPCRLLGGKGGPLSDTNDPPFVITREGFLSMKDATQTKADSEGSILAGYIAPTELCRQLGKTRRTIDRWHSRGLGPPRIRIERMVLYRIADVRAWLEAHLERREFRRGQAVGSAGVGGGK